MRKQKKIEFAEKVIQMVDHRVPVYVGTGACSTKETIRLSKKMEELGADALSVITPYFSDTDCGKLVQHFTAVAESVSIRSFSKHSKGDRLQFERRESWDVLQR